MLQSQTVYSNVSKGILAKSKDLIAAFGIDDQSKICLEVCLEAILVEMIFFLFLFRFRKCFLVEALLSLVVSFPYCEETNN